MERVKRYKKPIIAVLVISIVVLGVMAYLDRQKGNLQNRAYTILAKDELVKSISVSGNIKSAKAQNVYSTLTYPVEEIFVEAGDRVTTGKALAKLDTANLELDIAQQRSSVTYSQKAAELDLETKKTIYENNKSLFEFGAVPEQELDQSERNYILAQANYDNDSQKILLQKLRRNLAESVIESPIEGTVTEVFAEVGVSGSRLLFVIEDTDNLVITAYLKEYDIGQVHPGQAVTIKADATGEEVFKGEVVRIWPASTKTPTGESIDSSTVEFETEVALLDHDPALKIGMNTRLNIIIEKKESVYSVPYNAITANEKGEDIVYTVSEKDGKRVAQEVLVEVGMESDFRTEILGDGVYDGLIVLNDVTGLKAGDLVGIEPEKE